MQQGFSDAVPDEIKQNLLHSLWNVLTPEKRVQVALYAHIEKPFGQASESTARVAAPQFQRLTKMQRFRFYEAAGWDAQQRGLFESLLEPLRQPAFEAIWSYLDPEARQRILAPE